MHEKCHPSDNARDGTFLYLARSYCCSPEGIRTLVAGLRSQSPRPLDDGALDFLKSDRLTATGSSCIFNYGYLVVYCAGVPGLEPRLTEPESAGLPITPYPNALLRGQGE